MSKPPVLGAALPIPGPSLLSKPLLPSVYETFVLIATGTGLNRPLSKDDSTRSIYLQLLPQKSVQVDA